MFLTKTAPSPRFRANLFMNFDIHSGRLIIPKNIQTTITKLDKLLLGRANIESTQILEVDPDDDIPK